MTRKNKTTKAPPVAYKQEFRDTAVRLALAGDKTAAAVAEELGIPPRKLYDWTKAWKLKQGKSNSKSASATESVQTLQKRVKQLEQENEILKQCTAYFAKTLL